MMNKQVLNSETVMRKYIARKKPIKRTTTIFFPRIDVISQFRGRNEASVYVYTVQDKRHIGVIGRSSQYTQPRLWNVVFHWGE